MQDHAGMFFESKIHIRNQSIEISPLDHLCMLTSTASHTPFVLSHLCQYSRKKLTLFTGAKAECYVRVRVDFI